MYSIILLVLLTLKIFGLTTISWWWVFSPYIIGPSVFFIKEYMEYLKLKNNKNYNPLK